VKGDLRAAGERVNLSGSVDGEASLAAQDVDVAGRVGRELHAAGEHVRLGSSVQVGEDARLAGEDVQARGVINGELAVAGETVLIDAIVSGDVDVRARRFSVGPNARIAGKLDWRAAEQPVIDPAAQITGGVSGSIREWREHGWESDVSPEQWRDFGSAVETGFKMGLWILAAFIGLVIALAFPAFFDRAVSGLRARPGPAFGWGVLLFVLWPVLILVLMMTVIGIPLAFVAMAAPVAGFALAAGAFGALAVRAQTSGGRLGAMALGLLAVGVLTLIPWFGWVIGFVVTLLGLGLYVVAWRPAAPTAAAPPGASAAPA
jgi:hypothetical protein